MGFTANVRHFFNRKTKSLEAYRIQWSYSNELMIEVVQTSSSYEEAMKKLVVQLQNHIDRQLAWASKSGKTDMPYYKRIATLPNHLSGLGYLTTERQFGGFDINIIKSRCTKLRKRGVDLKQLRDYEKDVYVSTKDGYNSYLKDLANYYELFNKVA